MKRNISYISILFLCIAVVVYFWESPEQLLQGFSGREKAKSLPYAIVKSASTRHFDSNGILGYSFKAEALRYFREEIKEEGRVYLQSYTEIDEPRLIIYHEGEPWLLESNHGKFTEENRHLLLWGNVVISGNNNNDKTTLNTEKLEIKPEEKYAYTNEPVKITTPSSVVTSKGVIANFQENQISLLAEVRGKHAPIF